MLYAYDLDGTLADTRQAVLLSYRAVGVEPPPDFFGKPWREWLNDEDLHRRKNEVYAEYVRTHVKPTRLVDTFKKTGGFIITGASYRAAHMVMSSIGIELAFVYSELTMHDKATILNMFDAPGIVFEDSQSIADHLRENTSWTVCRVL